jgi:Zn-dependent protease with chaperone function
MAAPKIPYPPSPANVPDGFTDLPDSFTRQQNLLLAGLFVFLIFYVSMVVLFGMLAAWCFLTMAKFPAVKIIGGVLSATFFLYLVKGFFKRPAIDKDMHVEITEDEHPVLFGFIHKLCDELGAPEPNKVFVSPDVNAACISRTSLVNLFVEPKRDLLIGLGLVNATNLSEFKAILAHEFGHFCHLGRTSSYTVVVKRIIFDLVEGEDWFDRFITWCRRQDNAISLFGHAVGGCLWVGRKVLWWVLKTITLRDRAVSREQEFHADLVAVSAAGSDASTHGLLRARFGMQCFVQAVNDLHTALDHKLYSNDLYLHQDRAAAVVRRKKKDPLLGLPPALPTPTSGKTVRVFDAERDELEDEDDTPPMWRTHPADADREANAKDQFVPAVLDHRSPWILFSDVPELKERMTYKFYRMYFRIPKNAELTPALTVQEYIDNEHAETTYDPKYHGAYDDRPLEPGDLAELDALVRDAPWAEDRMQKVYDKLYDGCREHAEAHADLNKELASLNNSVVGKPSPKMKRMIEDIEKKLDDNWEWFKSFDRRVYLLHVQMAARVGREWRDELVERYRFQMEVQRLYQEARKNQERAFAYATALFGMDNVHPDFLAEVMQVLRESWRALKKILQDARSVNLPAMKNFEEGENLADFILPEKLVPEPPLSYVKGNWCQKLVDQLGSVRSKCFRLHFKSVGGILALQEKIAAAWVAARAPVGAEVIEPGVETLPAGLVVEALVGDPVPGGEVLVAEVLPPDAGVVAAEVVDVFGALPADIIPAEVVEVVDGVPAVVPAAPAVAAFVANQLPPPAAHDFVPDAAVAAGPDSAAPREPEPEVFSPDPEPAAAESGPEPPAPADPTESPAAPTRAAGAAGAEEVFGLEADAHALPRETMLPAKGKRPAVRITWVRPGRKSPIGK